MNLCCDKNTGIQSFRHSGLWRHTIKLSCKRTSNMPFAMEPWPWLWAKMHCLYYECQDGHLALYVECMQQRLKALRGHVGFFLNAHRVNDLAAFPIQSVAFLVQSVENEVLIQGWHQADFYFIFYFYLPNTSLWGVYLHNMNPSSTIRLVFKLIPTSFPNGFVHILNHTTSTYYSFTCSHPILIQCKHSFIVCMCVLAHVCGTAVFCVDHWNSILNTIKTMYEYIHFTHFRN